MPPEVGYLSEFSADYTKALSQVKTFDELFALTSDWYPFAWDAHDAVVSMGQAGFEQFMVGLKKERRGKFAGEEFAVKYGAIMMPETLFKVSIVAEQYYVPWGTVFIQMKNAGRIMEDRNGRLRYVVDSVGRD